MIPISMQSIFLSKNVSQRQFTVTYGFHTCQRFYRKINKSPNVAKVLVGTKICLNNYHGINYVFNSSRSWLKQLFGNVFPFAKNLAIFFLSCDKIFATYGYHTQHRITHARSFSAKKWTADLSRLHNKSRSEFLARRYICLLHYNKIYLHLV